MASGSTVYSWNFFKEINSNVSFHITEDCQHPLLYWLLCLEFFYFLESHCVSTSWAVSLTQACCGVSIFSSFVKIFLTKTCFSVHIAHGLHFLAYQNFMMDLCLSLEHSIWFAPNLNKLETNIFVRLE